MFTLNQIKVILKKGVFRILEKPFLCVVPKSSILSIQGMVDGAVLAAKMEKSLPSQHIREGRLFSYGIYTN
jgi:hypothetical protein